MLKELKKLLSILPLGEDSMHEIRYQLLAMEIAEALKEKTVPSPLAIGGMASLGKEFSLIDATHDIDKDMDLKDIMKMRGTVEDIADEIKKTLVSNESLKANTTKQMVAALYSVLLDMVLIADKEEEATLEIDKEAACDFDCENCARHDDKKESATDSETAAINPKDMIMQIIEAAKKSGAKVEVHTIKMDK